MTFGESVFSPDVKEFIDTYLEAGGTEIDTAYVYNKGNCEKLLGEALPQVERPYILSTKVNPRITGRLDADAAYMQVTESLQRLGRESVDTIYLHFPDPATPVEGVLAAMTDLHDQGKFTELGLSNFPAWMIADVCRLCEINGWVKPTVFQGGYNPLARNAEAELFDCLHYFGIRFYAFNPLAGGILSGKYKSFDEEPGEGRFTNRPNYRGRYWKKSYFEALDLIRGAAEAHGISVIEATYRWLAFHSALDGSRGDGILIGASKLHHLKSNLQAFEGGPLPEDMIGVFEQAWEIARPDAPKYFTLYKGKGSVGGEKA